jgi:hypothetical protein
MHDIVVELLKSHRGISIVSELRAPGLDRSPGCEDRDVVLVGPRFPKPESLFGRCTNFRLVVLRDEGRRAEALSLAVTSSDLGEVTPARLAAVLSGEDTAAIPPTE